MMLSFELSLIEKFCTGAQIKKPVTYDEYVRVTERMRAVGYLDKHEAEAILSHVRNKEELEKKKI